MAEYLQIKPGDKVRIYAQGTTREGIVDSAVNYGNHHNPCWYIELTDKQHGPVYWRQDSDGGTVTKL